MLMPPPAHDPPTEDDLKLLRSFFEPYIVAGDQEHGADLRWPIEPPPGWSDSHSARDRTYETLTGIAYGLNDNSGFIMINRPSGWLLWQVLFEAARATGWLMFDGSGPFAISSEQVSQWRQMGCPGDITMVESAAALQAYQGEPVIACVGSTEAI